MITPHFSRIQQEIISNINRADLKISIAVCWFTNSSIFDVLCSKLEIGILIDLIIIDDAINNGLGGLNFDKYIKLGGNLYFADSSNLMHDKFCVIDDKIVITGSYNWTFFAENRNIENIVVVEDDNSVLSAYYSEFIKIKGRATLLNQYSRSGEFVDLFSTKKYLSAELFYHSIDQKAKGNLEFAQELAIQSNVLNHDAATIELINEIKNVKDSTIIYNDVQINEGFHNGERVAIIYPDNTYSLGTIRYQRSGGKKSNFNGDTFFVNRDGFKGIMGVHKQDSIKLIRVSEFEDK